MTKSTAIATKFPAVKKAAAASEARTVKTPAPAKATAAPKPAVKAPATKKAVAAAKPAVKAPAAKKAVAEPKPAIKAPAAKKAVAVKAPVVKKDAAAKKVPAAAPAVSEAHNLEFKVFAPQGTVRGYVIAVDHVKGIGHRVAHAHLLAKGDSVLTLDNRSAKMTPAELLRRAEIFTLFANKVKELDAGR